jgi:uncharacterized membrane protein
MNGKGARRLLWILAGLVAIVLVAAIAYRVGVAHNGGAVEFFGPRGFRGYGMTWAGGWFGLVPGLLLLGVLIFLFVVLISGAGSSRSTMSTPPAASTPGELDRLRELSEMHDRGALTDDEFTAAKHKLLGL